MARVKPQPFKVYRVGGSVRDDLLGRHVADRDWVVVGATPEVLVASGFKPVGRDFPVFLHPETREEYALARTERKHGRGYRGFEFFASPDVTLEEDLARRDLTINAMARDDANALIDPHGGEADLRARILRHVSPAFVEDPLRVLRVARFAARLGFAVAPETLSLMREIVASGELATIAPERVWQEFARGLMEATPSRMLEVLRDCGALRALVPEIDAVFASRDKNAGNALLQSLDRAAARDLALPVRFALLAMHPASSGRGDVDARARIAIAAALVKRLKVPQDCRDAAMLAARFAAKVGRARGLAPSELLALLMAADALRRPERLSALLEACAVDADEDAATWVPANTIREALDVVRNVDAGAIARAAAGKKSTERSVGEAVRKARLTALRAWKRAR
jgi:tRNA nucleotidyltransferase (CCA-adding enzyme)